MCRNKSILGLFLSRLIIRTHSKVKEDGNLVLNRIFNQITVFGRDFGSRDELLLSLSVLQNHIGTIAVFIFRSVRIPTSDICKANKRWQHFS